MNIWIITTGNSDVQLKNNKNWSHLSMPERPRLHNRDFQPSRLSTANADDPYLLPARVTGIVYGNHLEKWDDLHFPLFDCFSNKLIQQNTLPNKVIIILTDQTDVFDPQQKHQKKCPYWQDTCELRPIIETYFNTHPQLKDAIRDYIYLKPTRGSTPGSNGLDNWDSTLSLVQTELSKISIEDGANIYVSHQAGTPAISSAIQFVSLAKFGKQVNFLVSNEYQQDATDIIESPRYLKGIQIQQAKALLDLYNYAAVQKLLKPYWDKTEDPLEKKIRYYLLMATCWNYGKFEKAFEKSKIRVIQNRINQWWWVGYEAAYLAVIRLEQGNTTEALFHSFRAVEGLIYKWAQRKYQEQIQVRNNTPYIYHGSLFNTSDLTNWFDDKKHRNYNNVGLFGDNLFTLLKASNVQKWNNNPHIQVAANDARNERNATFHKLLGLTRDEVYKAWNTNNKKEWEERVLGCLNFISEQQFTSLKEASLISQIHEDLKADLDKYQT
jgi:hypothetical protein